MAFFEMTGECLREIPATTFSAVGIRERADLQRLLRDQIDVVASCLGRRNDILIVSEEFADWEESNRRIDLLGLDKDANLVVFELKRTEDGGHMDLQAIRYAAMVSTLTFETVEEVFAGYLRRLGKEGDARSTILEHLGWENPGEEAFAENIRIVLVSAEFSKELTTSVMWLNKQGLDICCVRIKPYLDTNRVLVDVQRIIPLPEADDYTVRIKQKQAREKADREEERPSYEFRRRFWEALIQFLASDGHPWAEGKSTTKGAWISSRVGKSGIEVNVGMARESRMKVEIYCSNDTNKKLHEALLAHKTEIEGRFPGETVSWERLKHADASRVAVYRPYDKDQVAEDTAYRRELFAWISKNLTTFRVAAKQYLVDRPLIEAAEGVPPPDIVFGTPDRL
jgi:hypothetical protein